MEELLERYLSDLNAWIILIIVLVIAVVTGLVLSWIFFRLLHWNGKRYDKKSLYNIAIRDLEVPARYFAAVFLAINTIDIVPISEGKTVLNSLFPLTADMLNAIKILMRIVLYIVSAWLLRRLGSVFITIIENRNNINTEDNLRQRKVVTQLQFIRKIASVIIIGVTFCLVLLEFEEVRKIGTGLLTSAGVAGIIIGIAAQKSIANLLAGLQIAITQPIRLDDVVIVEGEFGWVEEITLTYVLIRIWDQRRLIIPLNYFIEKPFENWTRFNSELLGSVFIYADYDLPIEALREELNKITEDHPLWDKRVRNVMLTDLTENTMKIRLLVSARSAGDAFDLRCFVREHMITFIQKKYPESLPKTRVEMLPIEQVEKQTTDKKDS